jgi:hypothetical protein
VAAEGAWCGRCDSQIVCVQSDDGGAWCGRGDSRTALPQSGGIAHQMAGHDLGVASPVAAYVVPMRWLTPATTLGVPPTVTTRGAQTPEWPSRWPPSLRSPIDGSPRAVPHPTRPPPALEASPS